MSTRRTASSRPSSDARDARARRAPTTSCAPRSRNASSCSTAATPRVAEPDGAGGWRRQRVAQEGRAAVTFARNDNRIIEAGHTRFFDKVPLKYAHYDADKFRASGARVVPDAIVRRGAYIARDVVLMPSFVNIGAHVDKGTMVDTWATVGCCAQIGKGVHLSGGVGIGGVLEPLQAAPTIIEDDCFIGARSEVVEGVIVERGSVLGMGVFIGAEHAHLRSRDGRDRPTAACPRARSSSRGTSVEGRQVQLVLRRDREEGRREDSLEDLAQRAPSHGGLAPTPRAAERSARLAVR